MLDEYASDIQAVSLSLSSAFGETDRRLNVAIERSSEDIHILKHVRRPFPAFKDRFDAGRNLVEFVKPEPKKLSIVLALPRGGVPVGEPLAEASGAPLSLVLVRKLPIPISPEMGFGAVTIDGTSILNERVVSEYDISKQEIEAITQQVKEEVIRRAKEYLGNDWKPEIRGMDVYLVDDGLATGYSMIAAASMIRKLEPRNAVLCVPVSPATSIEAVQSYFDEIYCLIAQDRGPFAVASFYEDFHEMDDDEVREILDRRRAALPEV
jgi:putative phosphoribosyl transferase